MEATMTKAGQFDERRILYNFGLFGYGQRERQRTDRAAAIM